MESMMCKIKESDVSRTTHVMNFDLNMDGNIEGDGGSQPRNFEGNCVDKVSDMKMMMKRTHKPSHM